MQTRTWRQALSSFGGAAVLLAVPVLALGVFAPRSWQASASAAPVGEAALAARPATLAPAVSLEETPLELNDWADTFNPSAAQVAALNAGLASDRAKYVPDRNVRYNALRAQYKSRYHGARLQSYLILAYKNLSIENINFQQFEYKKINALYQGGVVSASQYQFVALMP